MRIALLFILFITATSCQYFDTEKISAETFYEEEIKTIDLSQIDTYPIFQECANTMEKEETRLCFENELTARIAQSLSRESLKAINSLQDTLWVNFTISEKAIITVNQVKTDSLIHLEFPKLQEKVIQKIDSFILKAPAYKRGIPVKTSFNLPIVIRTE
jgi:hypothetical protein